MCTNDRADYPTHLLESREDRQLERAHRQLVRHHLIVLDELGYIPFSKAGAERLTGALLDRLTPHSYPCLPAGRLDANGESYRLRESKRRRTRRTPAGHATR